MSANPRQWPDAHPLIGNRVVISRSDGKSRILIEKEVTAVVVVDNNGHVRLELLEPCAHRDIGIEQRLPVRIGLGTSIVGTADGRHVRGSNACNDATHAYLAPLA